MQSVLAQLEKRSQTYKAPSRLKLNSTIKRRLLITKGLRTAPVKPKRTRAISVFLLGLGSVGLMVSAVLLGPKLYYQVVPVEEVVLPTEQVASVLGGKYQDGAKAQAHLTYRPPYDPSLPDGDWLIIDQIGVRTPLRSTQDPAQAISQGVWLAPDYGRPGDTDKPIILAAHRFGYKWWWQGDYWKKNSFYKLPQTKAGTLVKIISDHRQWEYEIYKAEEGDELTDYDADLILYTCKFLNSPVRHIRYARLIDPTKDTQQF